ncbi:MAG: DUF6185 family protein, partial [Actinoplanes sp.]
MAPPAAAAHPEDTSVIDGTVAALRARSGVPILAAIAVLSPALAAAVVAGTHWNESRASSADSSFCTELQEQTITGSTVLVLGERERGVATAESTLIITVPAGWNASDRLLTDDPDVLRSCLGFTSAHRSEYQARLSGDRIVANLTMASDLDQLDDGQWLVRPVPEGLQVSLNHYFVVDSWSSVTVRLDGGLRARTVKPRPKTYDGRGSISWTEPTGPVGTQQQFDPGLVIVQPPLVGLLGWVDENDLPDWAVGGFLLFGVASIAFLTRLRDQRAHDARSAGTLTAAAGAGVALTGAIYQATETIYFASPLSFYEGWVKIGYVVALLLLSGVGLLVGQIYGGRSTGLSLLGVVLALPALAYGWIAAYQTDPLLSSVALSLFLIVVLTISRLIRPTDTVHRRWLVVAAAAGCCYYVLQASQQFLYGADHMLELLLLAVLVLWLVERFRSGLFEPARERLTLALAISLILGEGLRWDFIPYVDPAIPLVSISVLLLLTHVLARVHRRAILPRVGGLAALTKAGDVNLQQAQADLVRAEETLRSLHDENRALNHRVGSGDITTHEKMRRSRVLQRHMFELRSIPPQFIDDPGPAPPDRASWRTRLRRRLFTEQPSARTEPPVKTLPARVNPVDVALALGPEADGLGNARRSLVLMAAFGLVPGCYFVFSRLSGTIADFSAVTAVEVIIAETVFWCGYGLMFGLLWQVLPGRRGSTKALLLWTGYLAVVAAMWGAALAVGRTPSQGLLLRGLVLLAALLITGLLMDLRVMRAASDPTRPVLGFFSEYYRLNRIVPTVTLILPLVASAVGIWSQIDKPPAPVS